MCIGLDVGLMKDHSALVAAGAWRTMSQSVLGVFDIKQFALGTTLEDVADATAEIARSLRCPVVFDCSNNSAFASTLAVRFGANPANQLIAGVITNALEHSAQPTQMRLSLFGLSAAIPRWTLSKRELVESIAAEVDGGTLKIGQTGDYDALFEELANMEGVARQSGYIAYSAPSGKHDDVAMALSLAVFGLRRIGAAASGGRRRVQKGAAVSALAWT
jgi:cobyrinic acid a,c-diamide synthase